MEQQNGIILTDEKLWKLESLFESYDEIIKSCCQ